jgi:hypothetical protein
MRWTGQPNPASRNTGLLTDILQLIQAVTTMTAAAAKKIPGEPMDRGHEVLMKPELTPVSEKPGKQTLIAVANFIPIRNDRQRRGVIHIAEAPHHIPGIHVVRRDASKRAVTSRSLSRCFANKLQGTHIREFLPDFTCTQPDEVEPSIYSQVTWRY